MDPIDLARQVLERLDGMAAQQHGKLLAAARVFVPHLTEDDLKNPDDYPALHGDVRFNYEDGVLAGLRMSSAAVRALLGDSGLRP